MPLSFKNTRVIPPGGRYPYEVPETGVLIEGYSWLAFIGALRSHYAQNGLPVPEDLEAKVQDYICRKIPSGFCYGGDDGVPRREILTLRDIKAKTLALASGNPRVTPGVATQRSIVCGNCQNNDRSVCPTCAGLVSWARRLVGKQGGPAEEWLGVCTVDGTALAAKTHLSKIPDNDNYPASCWKRPNL